MNPTDINTLKSKVLLSHSPEDTWKIAKDLVDQLEPLTAGGTQGVVLALHGNLGSGKTCFVQGLALALGINQAVTSPTFTVVNEYKGRVPLYHIDLYRLKGPDEAMGFGFEEYLEARGFIAVEWAERAGDLIQPSAVHLYFEALSDADERSIRID